MSSILTDLLIHYRTACITAMVKRDKQSVEKYLSIILVLHKPTYIALKIMQTKKSK